jgi:hypothetical protein
MPASKFKSLADKIEEFFFLSIGLGGTPQLKYRGPIANPGC